MSPPRALQIARAASKWLLVLVAFAAGGLLTSGRAEAPKTYADLLQQAGRVSIWRVNPTDYFFAEALFGEWFSLTNDVVFARIDEDGHPHFAVALNRRADRSYTVALYNYDPEQGWPDMRRRTAPLAGHVGRKIEAAVNYRLHGLVLMSPTPLDPAHLKHSAWWIFRRNPSNQIETAMIAIHYHPASDTAGFLRGIVDQLQDYVRAKPEERSEFVKELEANAEKLASAESP